MAWLGEVKRSKRWLPSLDLITNSTCLSICFCWISADTGSIKLRPDKISSNTPSRKMRSQLPGPPAAIPLMTMSLSQQFLASAKAGAAAAQVAVQEEAPNSFSTGVAVPVTQFTKAGLKVEWLPYISVPAQSKWIPEEIKLANKSLNSLMPPFLGWLEANTLISFLSDNVLAARAESTRFGPHSTNKRTPES